MKLRLALSLLAILVSIPALAADPAAPLAQKLPAGTLVYAGWAGNSDFFQQSMLGQLLREPTTLELWKALQKAAARESRDGEATAALTLAEMLAKHPLAVGLTQVAIDEKGDKVAVQGVLLADLGEDKAKFAEALDALLANLPIGENAEEKTVGDVKFTVFKADPNAVFAWGYQGNMLIVGLNGAEQAMLATKPDGSLAKADAFVAAMKAVGGENTQLAYFVDIKRLMPTLLTLEKLELQKQNQWRRDEGMKPKDPQLQKLLATLGLDKATALAGTTRVVDKGLLGRCKIFSPAPHGGVLAMFDGKPLTKEDLAVLPGDSDLAGMIRMDAAKAVVTLFDIASKIDPKAAEELDHALAEVKKDLGVDLRKDLLASLGDTWTLSSAASQGGTLMGVAASVTIKDAKKLQECIDKIEARFKGNQPASQQRYSREPQLETTKYGDMQVRYVRIHNSPVAPAWAIYKDRFYVGLWPQVVASAARVTGEQPGSLTDNKGFANALQHMGGKPMAVGYINLPGLVKQFYGFVMMGWTFASSEAQREGVAITPADLPTLGQIEKYLWPAVSTISLDEGGLIFESYSSIPTLGLAHVAAVGPLSLAVAVPAVAQAKNNARDELTAANMRSVAIGVLMYAADNNNKLPPTLADLKTYVGGEIPVDAQGQPFVYLGPDVPFDAKHIFLHESTRGRQVIRVVYGDGRVVALSPEEFQRELKKSREGSNKGEPAETDGSDGTIGEPEPAPQPK